MSGPIRKVGPSDKRRVIVLFGGRSAEHEVSCTSAVWALQSLDQTKYDITAVGITKSGEWVVSDSAHELLAAQAAKGIHSFSRVIAEGTQIAQSQILMTSLSGTPGESAAAGISDAGVSAASGSAAGGSSIRSAERQAAR